MFSTLIVTSNLPTFKALLSTVLGFHEGRVIVPFLWRRSQVSLRFGFIMNLKRFDVFLDNKLSIIRFYLFWVFCLFFIEEKRWPIRVVVPLDPSIFIGNEMEDRYVRFSMKRKGEYSRIPFCVNLSQLFFLSHLTTPWKMFSFKNTLALLCFS